MLNDTKDTDRARDLMRRACELRLQIRALGEDIRSAAHLSDDSKTWSYAKAEARAEDATDGMWSIACVLGAHHGIDASDVDPAHYGAGEPTEAA